MAYALVEENQVVREYRKLPRNWKNVSGLDKLEGDVASLLSLGWYPVTEVEVVYDPATSYVSDHTYVINASDVEKTPVISAYTAEQLQEIEDIFFARVRRQRDKLLRECDWTMMTDVRAQQTAEWVSAWETYRQELRDLPQSLAGATDFNIDNVVWPTIPA